MEEVALGLGSNIGDAIGYCEEAVSMLGGRRVLHITAVSSWYATEPQGHRDQNWFINGAVFGVTSLSPRELLTSLKRIEADLGRTQTFRWGPRVIDIDILLYGAGGQTCIDEDDLHVPHVMLHTRRFVLIPLLEIAPSMIHPVFNKSLRTLLRQIPPEGQKVKRIKKR